jgi:nitroreductase
MDVIEAIHGRRSVRDYGPREPDRALIEAVIWDAAQAPTPTLAKPRPWVFNVVLGRERLAGYGARAKEFAREAKAGEAGWTWVDKPEFHAFWNAPALIVVSARADDAESGWDCCRAAQNLMLSAHARGLGSCWVGAPMLWLTDAQVRAELGIPADFDPVAPILLGYPASPPPPGPRERPRIIWSD